MAETIEHNKKWIADIIDMRDEVTHLSDLSRSRGLKPITVTQNYGDGDEEKAVMLFDFDNPENDDTMMMYA